MQVPISDAVIVMEKEFKSKMAHTRRITCLTKISDSEFVTSSEDMSFKIWDKDMQGCRYTIETHEPLHTMAITGEK
jgi:WD40 repeat protein